MTQILSKIKYAKDIKAQYDFMVQQETVQEGNNYKPWKSLKHPVYLIQSSLLFGFFDTPKMLKRAKDNFILSAGTIASVVLAFLFLIFNFKFLSELFLVISFFAVLFSAHSVYEFFKEGLNEGLTNNSTKTNDFLDFIEDIVYPNSDKS